MGKPATTWTRKKIEELANRVADQVVKDFEQGRISPTGVGCMSALGCLAGKKHKLEHELKFNSDLHNLLAFRDDQLKGNAMITQDLLEASAGINIAANNLKTIVKAQDRLEDDIKENKKDEKDNWKTRDKRIDKYEFRFWGMVSIVVAAALLVIWQGNASASKVEAAVQKVNVVDTTNQGSTELLMVFLASKISGQTVDEIEGEVKALSIKKMGSAKK